MSWDRAAIILLLLCRPCSSNACLSHHVLQLQTPCSDIYHPRPMAACAPHARLSLPHRKAPSPCGALPPELWCRVFAHLDGDLAAVRALSCVNSLLAHHAGRIIWPNVGHLTITRGPAHDRWELNDVAGLSFRALHSFLANVILPNARNIRRIHFRSREATPETFPGDHIDFFQPDQSSNTDLLHIFAQEAGKGALSRVESLYFGHGFCAPYPIANLVHEFSPSLRSLTLMPLSSENPDLESSDEFWNALPQCDLLESISINSFTFPTAFSHLAAAVLAEPKALAIPDAECFIEEFQPYEEALVNVGSLEKLSLLERETSPKQVFMTWASDDPGSMTIFEVLPKILLTRLSQGDNSIPRNVQVLEISPDFRGDLWDWFTLFPDLKELRLLQSFQNSPYGVDEQGVRRLLSHSINKYLMVHKGGAPERKTLKVYGLQLWHKISELDGEMSAEGWKDLLVSMLATFPTYFGPTLARSMIRKVPASSDWAALPGPLYICEDSNIFIEMYW